MDMVPRGRTPPISIITYKESFMNTPLKAGIAGFAAWKWGGGILGAIVLFLIVFFVLGRL